MYSVKWTRPADDRTTVKEAFRFVSQHADTPDKWMFPKYKTGIAGYDNWIDALEEGKANGFGNAYNAVVWHECRGFAVDFLKEAKKRLGTENASLYEEAVRSYKAVADNLKKVYEAFPFRGPEG